MNNVYSYTNLSEIELCPEQEHQNMSSVKDSQIPFWRVGVDYQENDLVIKDGVVCKYWRYPKTGELVWLSENSCHQYDMFIMYNQK